MFRVSHSQVRKKSRSALLITGCADVLSRLCRTSISHVPTLYLILHNIHCRLIEWGSEF